MNWSNDGDSETGVSGRDPWKPTPDDFDVFLPWACRQLRLEVDVVITNIVCNKYLSKARSGVDKITMSKSRTRHHDKDEAGGSPTNKGVSTFKIDRGSFAEHYEDDVAIHTVYDNCQNLIQIKFNKNKRIPRLVLKIIGLILKYHVYLANITINKGLNKVGVYELNKLLLTSQITDVCLDGTAIYCGNYDILLEKQSHLRQLSLARCNITDEIVNSIASKLAFPLPASKTLCLLNLASNKITNVGAKYLADTLKTNRQLVYLNLADNRVTDDGAGAILNNLIEFLPSSDELLESKTRFVKFWKIKQELSQLVPSVDEDKRAMKRKSVKPGTMAASGLSGARKSKMVDKDTLAALKYINEDDEFNDPYSAENTYTANGSIYCYGNNVLAYLNLAYNDISYFTVKKILNVLKHQKSWARKPKGLISVSIEGNCIPVECPELQEINSILSSFLGGPPARKFSLFKKKP